MVSCSCARVCVCVCVGGTRVCVDIVRAFSDLSYLAIPVFCVDVTNCWPQNCILKHAQLDLFYTDQQRHKSYIFKQYWFPYCLYHSCFCLLKTQLAADHQTLGYTRIPLQLLLFVWGLCVFGTLTKLHANFTASRYAFSAMKLIYEAYVMDSISGVLLCRKPEC